MSAVTRCRSEPTAAEAHAVGSSSRPSADLAACARACKSEASAQRHMTNNVKRGGGGKRAHASTNSSTRTCRRRRRHRHSPPHPRRLHHQGGGSNGARRLQSWRRPAAYAHARTQNRSLLIYTSRRSADGGWPPQQDDAKRKACARARERECSPPPPSTFENARCENLVSNARAPLISAAARSHASGRRRAMRAGGRAVVKLRRVPSRHLRLQSQICAKPRFS